MNLLDRLPKVAGTLEKDAVLSEKVFFGVGGQADVLFIPKDNDDLSDFLRAIDSDIPVTILGSGSNVLIRDGGIRGVVIKLGKQYEQSFVVNDVIEVGAALSVSNLTNIAMDNGLAGLEFLIGIPGSVGGALKMNAGCYGSCFKDIFVEAEAMNTRGENLWLTKDNIELDYRRSSIGDDVIITRVWVKGKKALPSEIAKNTYDLFMKKKKSQPLGQRSCGSVFKNPSNSDKKAWQLIDEAGCRGMELGGAKVSNIHCNFIINAGNATAKDIEDLGTMIEEKVYANSGVKLEWEVVKLGERYND